MKGKKLLAAFLAALMTIGLVPAVAFAEEAKEIYVSAEGSDEYGNGSEENPYASLAKAADVINESSDDDFVIYVMSNLTSTACARFYNKNVTITSATSAEGEDRPYTVTRGDNFSTISDTARGWYNPAMIEFQAYKGKEWTYVIKNLTLDDDGKHEGVKFEQAVSGEGRKDNTVFVQDAIVASNATVDCNIILGKGAVLRNFGGMSAVRVTDKAKLIMKSGSKICDDAEIGKQRTKGDGVLCQSASIIMEKGSLIENIYKANGVRIQYGGTYSIGGTISNIDGCGEKIHALIVHDPEVDDVEQECYGIITETGLITGARSCYYGAVYVQSGTLEIYGKITDNVSEGRGGGLTLNNNYGYINATMYPGAEISGNSASQTGGGVSISEGTFTMLGGVISGNKAPIGGGFYIHKSDEAEFIMKGGVIENNTATDAGGGVTIDGRNSSCQLLKGSIINNREAEETNDIYILTNGYGSKDSPYGYMRISDDAEIGNPDVHMAKDNKYVTPVSDDLDLKLGNASKGSITALKNASAGMSWGTPLQTLWCSDPDVSTHLKLSMPESGTQMPFYALVLKTGEDGNPIDGTASAYAVSEKDGKLDVIFKSSDNGNNGYAVAIVQPTADYGNVVITGPDEIVEDESAESYDVDYKAVYTMSDSFINMLKQDNIPERVEGEFTFTVKLDSRLKAKSGEGEYKFTSDIFDIKDFDVIDGGSTIVARCSLKDGWKASLDKPVTMTLTGTGVLSADDFEEGGILATSGEIDVTDGQIRILIPGNVAETKMVGIKRYTVTFDEGSHGTIDDDDIEKTVTGGKTVGRVPDVEPDDGYKFIGWKIDDEGKLLSDDDVADYTVTGNITFVAQYEKKGSDSGYELPEKHIERPEEKPELETKEHFQYISGYPDGTVRPNANITRAEVATIFYRLLSDDSRNAYFSTVENFSDVQNTDWFLKAVATLTNAGILHGDEGKDTYRPNDSITRAEFATIVSFFDDLSYTGEDRFSDIAGHWANAYINSASANGWISGYPNGTFNPDAAITRAEAMTIINNVLGREVDGEGLHWKTKMWPDNPNYAWFYYEVLEATNYHDYVRESEDEAEEWTDIRPNKVWNEGAAN